MSEPLTLSDVCLHIVDCVNRTAPESIGGTHFAVGTPAMRRNTIDLSKARRLSEETFATWTRRLVPEAGDLLFAREAPVGPVVRIPEGGNIAAGQRTTHLRADPNVVDARFLYYLMISPVVQSRIAARVMGSTVGHLRVADVKSLQLPPLPSLPLQIAVSAVLGSLDDKIAANSRLSQSVEHLLKAEVDLAWLHARGGRADGREISILEMFEVSPSVAKPDSSEAVYVDMKKLPESGSGISSWDFRPAKGGARFSQGDTLLARITPCLENRKTGYVDFLDEGEIGVGSTEFIVLRSRAGVPKPLSYFLAVDDDFRDFAIRHMVGTSGRQRVSASDISSYVLPAPDPEWMRRFGSRAEEQFELMKSLRGESRTLAELRDTLLPELMSGRLRVKDAEKKIEEVV